MHRHSPPALARALALPRDLKLDLAPSLPPSLRLPPSDPGPCSLPPSRRPFLPRSIALSLFLFARSLSLLAWRSAFGLTRLCNLNCTPFCADANGFRTSSGGNLTRVTNMCVPSRRHTMCRQPAHTYNGLGRPRLSSPGHMHSARAPDLTPCTTSPPLPTITHPQICRYAVSRRLRRMTTNTRQRNEREHDNGDAPRRVRAHPTSRPLTSIPIIPSLIYIRASLPPVYEPTKGGRLPYSA